MKIFLATAVMLGATVLIPTTAHGGPVQLVKDVNPGPSNGVETFLREVDGRLVLWGTDASGRQPWISDGTEPGTHIISVLIGSTGSLDPFQRGVANSGKLFFLANDGFTGNELWRTDGTAAGTVRLTDIMPGSASSTIYSIMPIAGGVVFAANGGGSNVPQRLWRSDGTALGTAPVGDFSFPANASSSAVVDNRVLFGGYQYNASGTSVLFSGLMATDGTAAGTTNIQPFTSQLQQFVAVNERLYFSASDATNGRELWTSLGTAATTIRLSDIIAGNGDGLPEDLTRVDDRLFFTASEPTHGRELWTSDGTPGGTVFVKDIRNGIIDGNIHRLVGFGGKLYFTATDDTNGEELWVSDGTDAGTTMLVNLNAGANSAFGSTYNFVRSINRRLMMSANVGGSSGAEPYISDGTATGTRKLDPTYTGSASDLAVAAGGRVMFPGSVFSGPGQVGRELYGVDALTDIGPAWCKTGELGLVDMGSIDSITRMRPGTVIADLNLGLDFGHLWIGDLIVTLTHVDTGTSVVVLDRPGRLTTGNGCSGKLVDIVLDDSASTAAESTCTASRPAYPRDRGFRPNNPLSAFSGQDSGGEWKLTVQDAGLNDVGTLHEWCLFVNDTIFASGFQ